MNDMEFKQRVCEDLGYIKAKIEILETRGPCENKEVKRSMLLNRKMIFSLYGLLGSFLVGLIISFTGSIF